MDNQVVVHKGRDNELIVDLQEDVSTDTFESQIRSEPDQTGALIATWNVNFVTDGTDGLLSLTLTDVATAQIAAKGGYMDIKRTSGTEILPVWDEPMEVIFRGTVTP
jgi:hypothetical protein